MVSVSGIFFFFPSPTTLLPSLPSAGEVEVLMHSFLVNFALISLLQRENITIDDTMDARCSISDRPCWASRFIFC